MKQFLTKILVFILPILALALPLDYGISKLVKQSNDYPGELEVMNDIYTGKASCDIAIYGSSRAWHHIDPEILDSILNIRAYNFGIDGHNFWLQYLRHLEILKHCEKPSQILLSIDVFSLQKRVDLYQPDQFLPYMLWDSTIYEYTSSYIGYSKFDYYIPLIRYSGKYNALKDGMKILLYGPPKVKYRTDGYFGVIRDWNSDLENAKAENENYVIEFDEASIELFERFIVECKELNIDLVFVYTPEYIDGQNYVSNRKDVFDIYSNLSSEYNLTFLDYSNDSISYDKSLFFNASHLNKRGAEIFTVRLANDLKLRKGKL